MSSCLNPEELIAKCNALEIQRQLDKEVRDRCWKNKICWCCGEDIKQTAPISKPSFWARLFCFNGEGWSDIWSCVNGHETQYKYPIQYCDY